MKIEEVPEDCEVPESDKTPAPKVEEPDDGDDEGSAQKDSDGDNDGVEFDDEEEDDEEEDEEEEEGGEDEENDVVIGDDDDEEEDEEDVDFFGGGEDDMFGGMLGMLGGGFGMFGDFGMMGGKKKKGSKKGSDDGVYQCFSSSSCITTGADGRTRVRETTSSTRKVGNKLSETQKSIRDTGTGLEKMTLKRSIGDKQRTVVKSRIGDGEVETKETLKGIKDDEKDDFDKNFVTEATKRLGTAIEDEPSRKKQRILSLPSSASVKSSHPRKRSIVVTEEDASDSEAMNDDDGAEKGKTQQK